MADARGRRITITIEGDGCVFQVSGKTIDFPGYLRAYVEGTDDPEAELADQETRAARASQVGEALDCRELEPKSHTTQPPARLQRSLADARRSKSWASAGPARTPRSSTRSRPATTSSRRATPWCRRGWRSPSSQLLEEHLPDLVDYQFTAQMEDDLDAISRGEHGARRLPATSSTSATARRASSRSSRTRSTRSTPASISRILHRHARRRRRADVRARRPLLAVRRAGRPHARRCPTKRRPTR